MRKLRISSIIIFLLAAACFVFYRVQLTRSMDTEGPVISIEDERIIVPVGADDATLLEGVTARDEVDGDVTDLLIVENYSHFIETGRRQISIAVSDSSNNVTKAVREIVYEDYISPAFFLSEPLFFPVNSRSITDSVYAYDVLDGDLTQKIRVTSDDLIWLGDVGEYSVTFQVTNSAGDISKLPVTLTIYDPAQVASAPQITLTDALVHLKAGSSFDPWKFIDHVTYRGHDYYPLNSQDHILVAEDYLDIYDADFDLDSLIKSNSKAEPEDDILPVIEPAVLENVEISAAVNAGKTGVYEVSYQVSAGEDDEEVVGYTRLIVVVDDVVPTAPAELFTDGKDE